MGGDRIVVMADGAGRRRPRFALAGLHAGVRLARVAGSGAVAGHRADPEARPAAATHEQQYVPRYLHRFSECCAGSEDPSMEVY